MDRPSAASTADAAIRSPGAVRNHVCRLGMARRDVAHRLEGQIRYDALPSPPFRNSHPHSTWAGRIESILA